MPLGSRRKLKQLLKKNSVVELTVHDLKSYRKATVIDIVWDWRRVDTQINGAEQRAQNIFSQKCGQMYSEKGAMAI